MHPTYIDELDSVLDDGVERDGDVLQLVVLVHRPLVVPHPPLLQHLDERAQHRPVPHVLLEVPDPLAVGLDLLQVDVHPVLERVGLDADPDLLLAADVHPAGSVALGTAGLEPGAVGVRHPPGLVAAGQDRHYGDEAD